jgi:hypothetical protein
MEVPATGGAVAVEFHAAPGHRELAPDGCRQRDLVQPRVLDVQDAAAGETLEVVVNGKCGLVKQGALRSCQPEDPANPLQRLQGGIHSIQRQHGMGLTDHLMDLSRADMPKLAHGPVHRGALGRQLELVGPERLGQLPPRWSPGG